MIRKLLLLFFSITLATGSQARVQACDPNAWPLWEIFKQVYLEDSGRIIDFQHADLRTTSEGQSYSMFFSLLMNDRKTFDRLWQWTQDNLLADNIETGLPAWLWGKNKEGAWEILDSNSASDADLWFVYTLLEAGRLWKDKHYTDAAYELLHKIEKREVVSLPGIGEFLLPGVTGFEHDGQWLVNTSYLPVFILRRLQQESPLSPWGDMVEQMITTISSASPKGYAADWYRYAQNEDGSWFWRAGRSDDDAFGSYDAIRNYLWAGMLSSDDAKRASLLDALNGMSRYLQQDDVKVPPEKVDVVSGKASGEGSFGFSAALLPYLLAIEEKELYGQQQKRALNLLRQKTRLHTDKEQLPYYDFVLSLFGLGWSDGLYRFDANGQLLTNWENIKCDATGIAQ